MINEESRHSVGVHLLLITDGRILLGKRKNTGFADGWWHLPGGKLNAGECLPAGAIREAREELGIAIEPEDLSFAHLNHHLDADGIARVGVFFTAQCWGGALVNAEPDRASEIAWFRLDDLPTNFVDYALDGVRHCMKSTAFGAHGW